MRDDFGTEAGALAVEARHWRRACTGLGELETAASTQAWRELESYLGLSVRRSLLAQVGILTALADRLLFTIRSARTDAELRSARADLLDLRRRYARAEAVVDFYGDAVNTRTSPRMGAVLRGLDTLAVHSMHQVLRPLGIETPPVLTYLDKGLGASILRSGARLWDSSLSPAAAIKITRHNLWQPTSLVHETGHQVAHLTGWNAELGHALRTALSSHSRLLAEVWQGWAGEVAADTYAFCLLGFAPVPALATVVDGRPSLVYRMLPGDPHPISALRVQFNVALCRSWFGAGPWDSLGARWAERHPLDQAPPDIARIVAESIPALPILVDVCTRLPMRAFGGVPLSALADPRRVSSAELTRFADRAGDSLYTSAYLQRTDPLRILAYTVLHGYNAATQPVAIEDWFRRMGEERAVAA